MAGLISDQLINNLRTVAYKQLVTPVTIKRVVRTEGSMGTVETLQTVAVTKCWFKPVFKGDLTVQPGGAIQNDSGAEFRFSVSTDVRVGDQLSVNGEGGFIVQDVNDGATIQLYLKAWTQRMEPVA